MATRSRPLERIARRVTRLQNRLAWRVNAPLHTVVQRLTGLLHAVPYTAVDRIRAFGHRCSCGARAVGAYSRNPNDPDSPVVYECESCRIPF